MLFACLSIGQMTYCSCKVFSLFHAPGLFQYPLKKPENQKFFDVFRRYRKRPMA